MIRQWLVVLLLVHTAAIAQESRVEVRWLSHAAFRIVSPGGKVIVIDPAMSAFATTPEQYKKPEGLGKVDLLLVTHGHWDHITDRRRDREGEQHSALRAGRPQHGAHHARRAAAGATAAR
jgi:L-ascorbate metabolism protein UlaG (beta-lactamase superfamily)